MAKEPHIELLLGGVAAWNARRAQDNFKPDLSGINLPDLFEQTGRLDPISQTRIPLSGANFTHTNFEGTVLVNADLVGADFSSANLKGANFTNADLTEATFARAKFADHFVAIAHADFTGVGLNEALLFPTIIPPKQTKVNIVNSIEGLFESKRRIEQLYADGATFYFRGERSNWALRPSILRKANSLAKNERKMLRDLVARRPSEFSNMPSALDRWVLAQHHGLKTRFIDLTKNPLVALFFACGGHEKDRKGNGRIRVFAVPEALTESIVKQYDSDVISIVTNFARLSDLDQSALLGKTTDPRSFKEAMARLLQFVQSEKPYFADKIDIRDFYRVFIVEPQQSIERIRAQGAAFIVSAFHGQFEASKARSKVRNLPIYDEHWMSVPKESKERILRDLGSIGITRETLFPGLNESAQAITQAYS